MTRIVGKSKAIELMATGELFDFEKGETLGLVNRIFDATDGADFIVFGPVYFTPSKAAYGAPQGVPALKKTVEIARLPVYAIGGIKPDNITELRSACVERVALISAIVEAPQPKQATEEIIRLLRR